MWFTVLRGETPRLLFQLTLPVSFQVEVKSNGLWTETQEYLLESPMVLSSVRNQSKPSRLFSAPGAHIEQGIWAPWGRGCHPDWELRILELVHASTLKSLAAFILELVRLRKWGCAGKFAKARPGFPPPGKQGHALFKPSIASRLTLRVWATVWRSRHFSLKRELLVSIWKASVAFRGVQNDVLNPEKKQKKVKSLSRVQLFATPWIVAYLAPPSMGFSRQEYWSGLLFEF